MNEEQKNRSRKAGRRPKDNPAVFRYSVSFNEPEHARFLSLFEQSGMKIKAHFIAACIFDKPVTVVKIDKAAIATDTYILTLKVKSQKTPVTTADISITIKVDN